AAVFGAGMIGEVMTGCRSAFASATYTGAGAGLVAGASGFVSATLGGSGLGSGFFTGCGISFTTPSFSYLGLNAKYADKSLARFAFFKNMRAKLVSITGAAPG